MQGILQAAKADNNGGSTQNQHLQMGSNKGKQNSIDELTGKHATKQEIKQKKTDQERNHKEGSYKKGKIQRYSIKIEMKL